MSMYLFLSILALVWREVQWVGEMVYEKKQTGMDRDKERGTETDRDRQRDRGTDRDRERARDAYRAAVRSSSSPIASCWMKKKSRFSSP
jgi:hypothetical protein